MTDPFQDGYSNFGKIDSDAVASPGQDTSWPELTCGGSLFCMSELLPTDGVLLAGFLTDTQISNS